MISLKSAREIEIMRRANIIVAEVLQALKERVAPGVTTLDLDAVAEELTLKKKRFRRSRVITSQGASIRVVYVHPSTMRSFMASHRTGRFVKAILSGSITGLFTRDFTAIRRLQLGLAG